MNDDDEWAAAVNGMTEQDVHVTEYEVRRAQGMCGDRDDARDV